MIDRLRDFIRYQALIREYSYRFLKFLDKMPIYAQVYARRIKARTSKIPRLPSELSIETINLCNASCTICAYRDMKRARGRMPSELVYSLIDQAAAGGVRTLYLSGFGEPLLDKRLPEFVALAKRKGLPTISIVTNGSLLTTDRASELIEAGLNEITVSIDGFTKSTYESIRIGLSFESVVENIKRLRSTVNSMQPNRSDPTDPSDRLRVEVSCVDLIHNRSERHLARRLLGPYVDRIYFRQAQGWTSDYAHVDVAYSPHFAPNRIPCRYLWDSMSVYIDGTVPACCLDYEAEGVMGNANQMSLAEIWQGERIAHYRRLHLDNRKSELRPCSKCGYYSVWW